jgi:1-acylglycerone phosphate reductase
VPSDPFVLPTISDVAAMYNASKAAVHLYSSTLRLELAPFGVRVLTIATGNVATSFKANVPTAVLPASSHYKPIASNIEAISNGSDVKDPTPSDVYAEAVVKDVLGGKTGQVWRGSSAALAKFAKSFFPQWLIVSPPGLGGDTRNVLTIA